MAWRIDEAVTRGEIDNTVEGHTSGRIWLVGRDEPLMLSLDGDCWRDLAGSRLVFVNPSPLPVEDANALDVDQTGLVGDITASRKMKHPTVSGEMLEQLYQDTEDFPFVWRNTLYLEWFSETNGRVVIESGVFRLTVSPHEWEMDEDAENAQKLANLNAMRDFMAQVIRRRDPDKPEPDISMDEFAWEERLKESDRLTDAYQEVVEKYMEDEDSEQKEAFVMGWDGLLDALAERDEAGAADYDGSGFRIHFDDSDPAGDFLEQWFDDDDDDEETWGVGGFPFDGEEAHPLQAKAQDLAIRALAVVEDSGGPGSAGFELISNLLQVSGKLAGVLHAENDPDYAPEAGLVLAVLKRCLSWLNAAVGACQTLIQLEADTRQRNILTEIRRMIFEVRDSVVQMRRELKK